MNNFRRVAPFFIAFFLVLDIFFLGILFREPENLKPQTDTENTILSGVSPTITVIDATLTATPSVTGKPIATSVPEIKRTPTTLGVRTPGSIEDIDLLADPVTKTDSVAMIRLYIENGEVMDFKPSGLMSLGACVWNKKIYS